MNTFLPPFFIKNKYVLILILIGVIFIFLYSWLYAGGDVKFSSPDETANYYFTKLYAEQNQLKFYEPLNEIANGLVKPRSMNYVDGYTVPSSFLGMILIYGSVAKIIGSWVILYLTPLMAVLAVLFFYLLLKEIFHKNIAFISSLLLYFLPPFWLYSARGMFHSILFMALFIIGIYLLVISLKKEEISKSIIHIIASGFFIGLSLITRTSEIIWIGFIVLIILLIFRKKLNWKLILSFLSPIIIFFVIILMVNNQIYGSPFSFSYSQEVINGSSIETISKTSFEKIRNLLFPFGINFHLIGKSISQYLFLIFPWYSIFLIIGLAWVVKNIFIKSINKLFHEVKDFFVEVPKKIKIYVSLYILMSFLLIIFYGSFEFYEYIDKTRIILGSSYLRYWLPIYIFGLPFIVIGIINISNVIKNKVVSKLVSSLIICSIIIFSSSVVLADPLHGIIKVKENNIKSSEMLTWINENIKSDAIIISGSADKVFFPAIKVLVDLPGDGRSNAKLVSLLFTNNSVYYFYNLLDNDAKKTIDELKNFNIRFNSIDGFKDDYAILYELQ